jgi:hypothetical protein
MSDAKIAQIVDLALQIQGLAEEILAESSSTAFKSPTPVVDSMKPAEDLTPFPRFVPGTYVKELTGEVAEEVVIREVNTNSGPVTVADVPLTDGQTTIKVSMWRDFAKAVERFNKGDIITFTNLKVGNPYNNVEQLGSAKYTTVA